MAVLIIALMLVINLIVIDHKAFVLLESIKNIKMD
jgi:hypothetical protein